MAESERTYWDVIEPIWDRVNIYDGPEKFFQSVVGIPRSALILYASHFCLSEIRNGGFHQFFFNSTGILGPEAQEGFGEMGMSLLAAVAADACNKLGNPYPRDRDDRQTAMLEKSGYSSKELEQIFKAAKSYSIGHRKATEPMGLDVLDKQVWKLADEENGGFDEAANTFCQRLGLLD